MAEGFWEQAVETYLTLDRGLFLNPQYLIGESRVWEANPDFLAIRFPESEVWMVEVTKTPATKLFDKISAFEQQYSWRIREQLTRHKIIRADNISPDWKIGLWIFAPSKTLPKLKEKAVASGIDEFKTTSLEDTTFPSWDERFR